MSTATTSPGTDARFDRDYPLDRVPASSRKGPVAVAIVVAGFLFYTPTMVTGGQVATSFGFGPFLALAAAATLILAAYIALLGAIGARTGLTTVMLSRLVLGRVGGKWASFILGGTQLGWYGVSLGVLGQITEAATGWPAWLVATIGGIVMASTAYFGFRGIELLSWVSVPLMAVLCVWIMIVSLGETGGWSGLLATTGDGSMTMGVALTAMIGTFISGGTQIGNWTRFTRGAMKTFVAVLVAAFLIQFAMLFFGGIGSAAFGEADFAEVLLQMGIVVFALLLLIANIWTTNDNGAYAFGVAGAELFGKPDKRPFIIGGVIISIVLSLTGIVDYLTSFLILLGVVIPPLGGALIGTFFLVWRGVDPGTDVREVPMFVWPGVAAYLAGAAAAGLGTAFDVGSPAVQGIVVAIIAAPVASAIARSARKR